MDYQIKRTKMVSQQLAPRGIKDERVLRVMSTIPRHRFVSKEMEKAAYDDCPLPIKHGQTISQPFMVALMTQALELAGTERVLEIGTGSGYQAAILAELSREVYTVEKIPELLQDAKTLLKNLGYTNIFFKQDDGTLGWPEYQPYDAVIVTAGAPGIPEPLIAQLTDGGRILVPVGDLYSQVLIRATLQGDELIKDDLGGCRFVPLKGQYGW